MLPNCFDFSTRAAISFWASSSAADSSDTRSCQDAREIQSRCRDLAPRALACMSCMSRARLGYISGASRLRGAQLGEHGLPDGGRRRRVAYRLKLRLELGHLAMPSGVIT